jgi:GPH family glycoside/pentoside/hexuronide:cation symporter
MPALSWGTRIAFGAGQFAEGVKSGAFSFFLLFYYNQVIGLSGTLSGAALLVAMSFDAVSDPAVGSLSDGFRSRWGRRHPFMYAAAVPFAISFYLLFDPPEGLGQGGLFVWLAVFSTAARTAMTFYSVPHMSLGAELSSDYKERTRLSSTRAAFGLLGSIAAIVGGFGFFFITTPQFQNGQLNPSAYPPFAAWAGVAMVVSIWLSALGTHGMIPHLPVASEAAGSFAPGRIVRQLRDALRIRSFQFLFSSLVSNYSVQGVLHTLSLYVLTYFWLLSGNQVSMLMVSGFGGMVVGALVASPYARWVGDKGPAGAGAMACFAIFSSAMVSLRLLGLGPENGSALLVPMIFAGSFLGGLGNGAFSAIGASMIADVTDEHERIYGVRQEGIYYGSISFAAKAASGVGTLVSGAAIDAVGLTAGAAPAAANSAAVNALGWVYGPGVLVAMSIPILLLRHYDIDASRHAAIRRSIEGR